MATDWCHVIEMRLLVPGSRVFGAKSIRALHAARRGIPRRRSPFLRELRILSTYFGAQSPYAADSASLHFGVSDKGYTATRG